jgi:hypothetical protein
MVALAGGAVVDRRRLELMGDDPAHPRFVYHNARLLPPAQARRSVKSAVAEASANARSAVKAAIAELEAAGHRVAAAGIIVGNQPVLASLEKILESHSLIHSAEGELFRHAVRDACKALRLPITEIPARELAAEAAKAAPALEKLGRAAGRPWAKDQRDAALAATLALRAR